MCGNQCLCNLFEDNMWWILIVILLLLIFCNAC